MANMFSLGDPVPGKEVEWLRGITITLTPEMLSDLQKSSNGVTLEFKLQPVLLELETKLRARLQIIAAEKATITQQRLEHDPNLPHDYPERYERFRVQWGVAADSLSAVLALRRHVRREEIWDPAERLDNALVDIATRGGIRLNGPAGLSIENVQQIMQEFMSQQERLPWREDHESETLPTDSSVGMPFEERLASRRERFVNLRKDELGRLTLADTNMKASQARASGLRYCPTEILDQYGLIKRKIALWNRGTAEKKYRTLKKRMRQKGIKISKVLSDDSEFSFDVDADHVGPDIRDHPGFGELLRRSKKWRRQMRVQRQFVPPSALPSCPKSHVDSQLPSLCCNSGMTAHARHDTRWTKRGAMWEKMQYKHDMARLSGRQRSKDPAWKKRTMHRGFNNFIAQMPEHFCVTNNEPRHRKTHNLSTGSSDPSTHGDFELWDRPHDP